MWLRWIGYVAGKRASGENYDKESKKPEGRGRLKLTCVNGVEDVLRKLGIRNWIMLAHVLDDGFY